MDFKSVLTIAKSNSRSLNGNSSKSNNTSTSTVKKTDNKNVGSDVVKAFLEKKKHAQQREAYEAEVRKRQLLEMRAAAKNNKKASAMAKRTKDNNFMAYLSVSERVAREAEITKHKEYLPVKKTTKNDDVSNPSFKTEQRSIEKAANNRPSSNTKQRPPSTINYNDLLNIAATKKLHSVELPRIPKKKVDDIELQGRPMTSEEKRKFLEEQARKQGRSVTTVNLPPAPNRGTKNQIDSRVATDSLKGRPHPAKTFKDAQKVIPQKPLHRNALPVKQTSTNQIKMTAQSKIEAKPRHQQNQTLPSLPKRTASDQNKNKSMTNCKPSDERSLKKSQPSLFKNQNSSTSIKRDQKSSVLPRPSITDRPSLESRMSKRVPPNGVSLQKGSINKLTNNVPKTGRPMHTNQRVEQQSQMKNVKAPSGSLQFSAQSQLRQQAIGPKAKSDIDRMNMRVMQNRPVNPQRISRDQLPSREQLPRRPISREPLPRRPHPNPHLRPPLKHRIESDEEYDDEMDDFIDDGPIDGNDFDYSSHIKEIFGYDRSRYDMERDDDIVESNFVQQMKEEAISTRMGILEDLEDIQREQDELKRERKRRRLK